jgi:hypothetical protein
VDGVPEVGGTDTLVIGFFDDFRKAREEDVNEFYVLQEIKCFGHQLIFANFIEEFKLESYKRG